MSTDVSAIPRQSANDSLPAPLRKWVNPEAIVLLEKMGEGFFSIDREWRFVYVNGRAEAMLRRSRNDLLGQVMWELFPGGIGTIFESQYRRALSERVPVRFEAFSPTLNAWFEVRAYPDGADLDVFLTDTTDKVRLAAALEASERRMRAVFDQQFQFICLLSPEGIVLEINEHALRSTGVDRGDVVGKPLWSAPWWRDLPEAREGWPERLARASNSPVPVVGETVYHRASGEKRYAETAVTAVRGDMEIEGFLIQAHDVTELRKAVADLGQAYEATLEGWTRTLDARDRETQGHSQRVADLTVQLARRLGYPESAVIHLHRGALLHDIGKMGVPDNVLHKPGPLDEPERELIRSHPELAKEILEPIDFLSSALDIPYYHHERWNGAGYPLGLSGNEIPWSARIFAVVDVFDALTSNRPYRKAWTKADALAYIGLQSGIQFDPEVVDAFLEMCEEKPEIESGEAER